MIFVMKENIFPDWSSPENMNGGFVSVKLDISSKKYNKIHSILRIWLEYLLAEEVKPGNNDIVTGLSLSPKNGHYILKVWLSEKIKQSILTYFKVKN